MSSGNDAGNNRFAEGLGLFDRTHIVLQAVITNQGKLHGIAEPLGVSILADTENDHICFFEALRICYDFDAVCICILQKGFVRGIVMGGVKG